MDIKSKIYTIRGLQVMLDSDLAELYDVDTKVLNQATKRNINRFPNNFMFQLTESEANSLRSQFVTLNNEILRSQFGTSSSKIIRPEMVISNNGRGEHRKYLPYVFTEQGVAMLSGILKSKTAVRISIQIMNAFVSMRKFIAAQTGLFQRVDNVEQKLIEHDKQFEQVFDAIENKNIAPDKGIFFDGQIFDAYTFVSDIIRSAKKSLWLVDNYIDDTVLTLFSKSRKDVTVTIYTRDISKQLLLDLEKYNSQYPKIELKEFKKSHDRFLIVDEKIVYHFGASLKDLGKKWFAFSRLDKESVKIIEKLN